MSAVGTLVAPGMWPARGSTSAAAAIAFGGPGVEQVRRPGRDVVDGRDRQVSGAQGHVARSRPTAVARRRAQSFGTPRRKAAVEKSHVGDTRPPQQPPGARGREVAGIVVHHHRDGVVDPPSPGRLLEVGDVGQRMPAADRSGGRGRQFGVEVDVDRTGDVTLAIGVPTIEVAQLPAHVQQDRRSRQQHLGQLERGDEDLGHGGEGTNANRWQNGAIRP